MYGEPLKQTPDSAVSMDFKVILLLIFFKEILKKAFKIIFICRIIGL